MTKEPVSFFSDGLRLSANLYRPDGPTGKLPAVVVCPGWGGSKTASAAILAEELVNHGYAALAFDFRGFGESEGPPERLIPTEQVADIRAAAAYLRSQEHVDERRVVALGLLNGASAALQAASEDPGIAAVVPFFPFASGASWMRSVRRYWEWRTLLSEIEADRRLRSRGGASRRVDAELILARGPEKVGDEPDAPSSKQRFLTLESADALISFRPGDHVRHIAPRPVIVVGIVDDLMIPYAEVRRIYRRAREPKVLVALHGISHHELWEPARVGAVVAEVANHLQRLLPPDAPPAIEVVESPPAARVPGDQRVT